VNGAFAGKPNPAMRRVVNFQLSPETCEAAHIKDVLSVLRWCENPRDQVAGSQALKLLPNVGPVAATKVLEGLKRWPEALRLRKVRQPSGTGDSWQSFQKLVAGLQRSERPKQVGALVDWYVPLMKHDNAELRAADLHQLAAISGTYETRAQFLMTPCRGYARRDEASIVLDLFSSPTKFIPKQLYPLLRRKTGGKSHRGTGKRIA